MGNVPDRWSRRLLRSAVHSRDVARLRQLTTGGRGMGGGGATDVNTVISDVFGDTALTCAVKYGYLEVVETLVAVPGCRLDQLDRNSRSALDEAVRTWLALAAAAPAPAAAVGARFRIIRCLLEAGARHVSPNLLDIGVHATLGAPNGSELLAKLVRLFCERGCGRVKGALLSVVVFYPRTAPLVRALLVSAALPIHYVRKDPSRLTVPLDNAVLVLRACARVEVLRRIDADTGSDLDLIERNWSEYAKLVRMFVLSGYPLQVFVVDHLFRCHADVLQWIVRYRCNARPLQHLARNVIRARMADNVVAALSSVTNLPESLKSFLLFSDVC